MTGALAKTLIWTFLVLGHPFRQNNLQSPRSMGPLRIPTQLKSKNSEIGINIVESMETPTTTSMQSDGDDGIDRRVCWKAAVRAECKVKEAMRSVESYMALPSSEYSVLSADAIERLSDTEFKATIGTMNFFGTKITPVLYVDVEVFPEQAQSVISVRRAETIGSEVALKVNGTFSIEALNTVSVGQDKKGRKTLVSETVLKVDVKVPASKLPMRVIRSGGNFIMQSSLNLIVPTFIRILGRDFARWSRGDDSRNALEDVSLSLE